MLNIKYSFFQHNNKYDKTYFFFFKYLMSYKRFYIVMEGLAIVWDIRKQGLTWKRLSPEV